MMKSTLMFVLAAIGGVISCPEDFDAQAMICYAPLINAMTDDGLDCGIVTPAVQCFRNLEEQCQGNAAAEAKIESLGLDMMTSICSPSAEGCPAMVEMPTKFRSCMTIFMGPGGCSSMSDGIACVEDLKSKCAGNPSYTPMFESMDMLESTYASSCPTSK